ncbi:BTB/POZ domain-containing protein At4g30940 [Selaginella moellendorffii]|uniref:BTB/POZ domain-containing protein At4g30940 n=1 Tax=Selaginella moellendorffii TaxID=88036 RepID=UPI000D1C6A05|nr:BTB/POZ domain-containing protein At4g30940 [Selaginella moellendorffii]|eukprot:XP_024539323.1 BTB/POZ domain-containing protein At4g30940 [Selaginella moellendorffii]
MRDSQRMALKRSDRVRINVGGTPFITSSTTIANAGADSMLCSLLNENWEPATRDPQRHEQDEIFIDRDPALFAVLLDLLRTGELRTPHGIPHGMLVREAVFYGIDRHVKAASWGSPLDGNRVRCRASVRGRATTDAVAIRASPGGGCGVAHGPMIHVYDWSLEELPPVTLDFMSVNDFGFLPRNPLRMVVCAADRGDIGGLGCVNAATGKLIQRMKLELDDSSRSFMALACASSDCEVFASSRMRGVGIWDQESGRNVGFVTSGEGGGGSKLQWLPSSNLLLVASMFPHSDHCFLTLLDRRQRTKAWEWSDCEMRSQPLIMDAVAIQNRNMICVVDQSDELGFIDTRMGGGGGGGSGAAFAPACWSHMFQRLKRSEMEEHLYSKLRINASDPSSENLQLFSTREEAVLVHSCSAVALSSAASASCSLLPATARLSVSGGGGGGGSGGIADIDVGGDRLFVLHSDENLFDVWESPPLLSSSSSKILL